MSGSTAVKFDSLIENVRARLSYRDVQAMLKEHGLTGYAGWKPLLERLCNVDVNQAKKFASIFYKALCDSVLAGTKDIYIFSLDDDSELVELVKQFEAIGSPNGIYASKFPEALSSAELSKVSVDHELAQVIQRDNGDISLLLCAKRTAEERTRYGLSEVNEAVRLSFDGFDEFIAIRRTDYQVFDVLNIRPKLRRVEVLIDQPDKIHSPETSEERCLTVLGRVMTLIPGLRHYYESNAPLNLASCINGMYQASNEGRVSRLSFRSPTDSLKKETMTSAQDLRTEAFHTAGVKAVGTITPYELSIVWDSITAGVLKGAELQVGMTVAMLSQQGAQVRSARVSKARSDEAIVAIVNKLVSYSSN